MWSRLHRTLSGLARRRQPQPAEQRPVTNGCEVPSNASPGNRPYDLKNTLSARLQCSAGVFFMQRQFLKSSCVVQNKETSEPAASVIQGKSSAFHPSLPDLSVFSARVNAHDRTVPNPSLNGRKSRDTSVNASVLYSRNLTTRLQETDLRNECQARIQRTADGSGEKCSNAFQALARGQTGLPAPRPLNYGMYISPVIGWQTERASWREPIRFYCKSREEASATEKLTAEQTDAKKVRV